MTIIIICLLCLIYIGLFVYFIEERKKGYNILFKEECKWYVSKILTIDPQDKVKFLLTLNQHRTRIDKLKDFDLIFSLKPFELKYWFTE